MYQSLIELISDAIVGNSTHLVALYQSLIELISDITHLVAQEAKQEVSISYRVNF